VDGPLTGPLAVPLGEPLPGWRPAARPQRTRLRGQHVVVRPLDAEVDGSDLFAASRDDSIWAYLPDGPYGDVGELGRALSAQQASEDPLFFTLARLPDERPEGVASYLRIVPEFGVIEIGYIWFGVPLQRTTAATEAIYLLAKHAFDDLGYRRLEWKCNALNQASRRAALRFGFTYEGVFRNHMVVKGRNRDSAWFGMTDGDWPAVRAAFEAWLTPSNFDGDGSQRRALDARPAVR
jgi:RimJ/RimL family protein N-acetyltransferase